MNRGAKLDCKHHGPPYLPEWRRKQCECRMCKQSIRDCEKSFNISRSHIRGRFCKEWMQCNKCSEIKNFVRILWHYSGRKCGRKCQICNPKQQPSVVCIPSKEYVIAELYGLILGVDIRGHRVEAAIKERQKSK
jgi:hypothetical protein